MAKSSQRLDEFDGVVKMNPPDLFDALVYHQFGKPSRVLNLEKSSLTECEEGEVIIQMQATALHPSDIGLINGSYGMLRDLPAVGGREGVGTIFAIGAGVDEKLLGKPVSLPESSGAWQEYMKEKVDNLILFPALVPFDQLAISLLNPMTAWRLLNDFEYLKPGDYIVQNAGNSAVGISIIQFAERLGIHCISLVRSHEAQEKILGFSKATVLIDEDNSVQQIYKLTGGQGCTLALNSVGGRSALRLAKCLSDGGVHVTFGAMDGSPIRFPTRNLIFNDIRFVGFWLDRWRKKMSLDEVRNAIEDVLQPLALTEIKHPVDSIFKLSEFEQAFLRNSETRLGKVLFVRDKKQFNELRIQSSEKGGEG